MQELLAGVISEKHTLMRQYSNTLFNAMKETHTGRVTAAAEDSPTPMCEVDRVIRDLRESDVVQELKIKVSETETFLLTEQSDNDNDINTEEELEVADSDKENIPPRKKER